MKANEHSLTRQLLQGKQVLITGTSGFLGKVVLEKILREIPQIGGVTLIVRGSRKYPDATERFRAEILSSSIFDRLKEKGADQLQRLVDEKVHCISAEVTETRFGLSEAAFAKLASEIDVFVNSAASVNFHEPLDQSLKINTYCLNQIAEFANLAGNIPVIQISTCYVNGHNRGEIREAVYGPAGTHVPRDTAGHYDIESIFSVLEHKIAQVKASITEPNAREAALTDLGLAEANRYGWGDTYTFTKWLGEQLIRKRLSAGTLTIVRPSVVESCWEEPRRGWIEGVKVCDAILLAYAREKVSFFPARKAGVVDIIPVDLVANSVILAMAETLQAPAAFRIYQSCSGSRNPLRVGRYVTTICEEVRVNWEKYPRLCRKQPQRKFILVNKYLFVSAIKAVQAALRLGQWFNPMRGKQPSKALKMLESTLKLTGIYATYTSPRYVFNNDRLMDLAERMGPVDKALFPVDAARIDWDEYFCDVHVAGLNHYGMEDRETLASDAETGPEEEAVPDQGLENGASPA